MYLRVSSRLREELRALVEVTALRVLIGQWGEPVEAAGGGAWVFAVFACTMPATAPLPRDCRWVRTVDLDGLPMLPADRAFVWDVPRPGRWARFRRSRTRWDGTEPALVAYE